MVEKHLRDLALKLLDLRALDPDLTVFGASTHGYENKPIRSEELKAFETLHGISLPEEYREWLLNIGVGAGPNYGILPPTPLMLEGFPDVEDEAGATICAARFPTSKLSRPFPLTAACVPSDAMPIVDPGANPYDGTLQVSEIGCGYFCLLVVTGPRRGQVWADYTDCGGGIAPLAASFSEWAERWVDLSTIETLIAAIQRSAGALVRVSWPHLSSITRLHACLSEALMSSTSKDQNVVRQRFHLGWLSVPIDLSIARTHFLEMSETTKEDDPRADLALAGIAWMDKDVVAMNRAIEAVEARHFGYVAYRLELAQLQSRAAWLAHDRARAVALAVLATKIQPWVSGPWLDLAWMCSEVGEVENATAAEDSAVACSPMSIGPATSGLSLWKADTPEMDRRIRFRHALATWCGREQAP